MHIDIFPANESLSVLADYAVQLDTLFIGVQTSLDRFTTACGRNVLCQNAIPTTDWIGTELEQVSSNAVRHYVPMA